MRVVLWNCREGDGIEVGTEKEGWEGGWVCGKEEVGYCKRKRLPLRGKERRAVAGYCKKSRVTARAGGKFPSSLTRLNRLSGEKNEGIRDRREKGRERDEADRSSDECLKVRERWSPATANRGKKGKNKNR
ncbi:hypothetical protein NE237_017993 [Protea cynaroides]|uniref:Uncharacterized protein n=1 Tax=Protea cynaroides TaxID=273540 RepID=A0A9Q0K942_9MAGN|nr:hypothetical protein NE237_017993 [Protea cynaroides]